MSRSASFAGLVVGALLALIPSSAAAAEDSPTVFDMGAAILFVTPERRASDLRELSDMGVDTVRVVIPWRSIAPEPDSNARPPAFNPADSRDYPQHTLEALDQVQRGAEGLGMRVLMTPSAPIPDWASRSGRSDLSDPIPSEFHDFVEALGGRYDGEFIPRGDLPADCPALLCPRREEPGPLPRATAWAIWNEPNIDVFLQPQFRAGRPYSPGLYRRLFGAGQAALEETGHQSDDLYVAETAPTGGRGGVAPLDFARGVLCLDAAFAPLAECPPIHATGWSHHPYGYAFAPHESPPNRRMVNVAELGRLTALMRRAYEIGVTSRMLTVDITEFGVLSVPHVPGVAPLRQATWVAASEFLAWRDPAIGTWSQYLLRDDPPDYEIAFTTGLRFHDGSPKPLRRAFPMTLLVRRTGPGFVRIWGHVRPADGVASVRVLVRGAYESPAAARTVRTVRTDPGGYFSFGSRFVAGAHWQAIATLGDGRRLPGPAIPALRFPLPPLR